MYTYEHQDSYKETTSSQKSFTKVVNASVTFSYHRQSCLTFDMDSSMYCDISVVNIYRSLNISPKEYEIKKKNWCCNMAVTSRSKIKTMEVTTSTH